MLHRKFTVVLVFFLCSLTLAVEADWYEEFQKQLEHRLSKRLLVDALTTPISVTGNHAFVAPNIAKGDQRGPCPGLNALANHGYIPRNGVASIIDIVAGANEVFGMGVDLATVLAVMGTVFNGNPISLNPGFSIGGTTKASSNLLGNLGGLLGTPRGLDGSHNFMEGDSSHTRDDLYMTGDAWTMNMDLFMEAYHSTSNDYFTFENFGQRAADRLQASIATNPNMYYGAYTGLIVRNAGYAFTIRLMSNHSKEHPEGIMSKENFRSFFGVSGNDERSFKYNFGHEQIPQNWYKTPVDYSLVSFNLDLVAWITAHPVLANIGGNTGKVNSFAGVDLTNVTGGVLNLANLLKGNNILCLALNIVKTFAPNSLSPVFATVAAPLGFLLNALNAPLLNLACPAFKDLESGGQPLWNVLMKKYPGAARAGSAM